MTPARGRVRPREFDRKKDLVKAMRVFWSLGHEATSMADLRKALGIKQASLYAAYGSKEALFREVVELYRQTDGIATTSALSEDLPPVRLCRPCSKTRWICSLRLMRRAAVF